MARIVMPLIGKVMAEWFNAPAFRGCAFINAVAEVGATLPGVLQIAQRHKQEMPQVIAELLPAGPAQATVAGAAALAVDGAIVRAQMERTPNRRSPDYGSFWMRWSPRSNTSRHAQGLIPRRDFSLGAD